MGDRSFIRRNPRLYSCIVLKNATHPFSLRRAATRVSRQPLAVLGILLLAAFFIGGVLAPWLAPQPPASIDLVHRLQGPSASHWAGTDELGRDTLSRLLWGARLSLAVSVSVVAVSLALGLGIGGLAGYLGGWVDTALTTFAMNTFLALPGILLAIAFAAFLGPGFSNLVLALAIGGWAGYARLVRAQVMAVREREYVDAARALGAGGMRIFFRHILPNIVQPILVQAAIGMAGVILAEATLSFLGLGIPCARAQLGIDAQRRALASVRLAAPGALPCRRCGRSGAGLQLSRRRAARPARPADAAGAGDVKAGTRDQGLEGVVDGMKSASSAIRMDCCGLRLRRRWLAWSAFCTWAIWARFQFCASLKGLRRSRRFAGTLIARARAANCRRLRLCELEGRYVYMLHDLKTLHLDPAAGRFAAVLFGHTHQPTLYKKKGVLYFNPGSCGPRRFELPVTIGLLTIDDVGEPVAEIVPLKTT